MSPSGSDRTANMSVVLIRFVVNLLSILIHELLCFLVCGNNGFKKIRPNDMAKKRCELRLGKLSIFRDELYSYGY